jgi:hypothetical protein
MAEVMAPNIFGNFLAGRQARQGEEQQAIQNQFLQRRQQMQEAEFQAQQEEMARQQQFNQLAGQFLGQDTVDMAGGMQGGAPGMQQPMQRPSLSQLAALDPQRAMQMQQFQAQQQAAQQAQQQEQAKTAVLKAQYVMRSESPATLLRIGFPDFVAQLQEQGMDVEALDDDQVRSIAENVIAQFGPMAGIAPADEGGEQFTLGEGQTRFDAQGRPIASVAKQPSAEDENRGFNRANVLRDEFTSLTKDYAAVQASFDTIQSVAAKPSAAGDISLLTAYMRMIDPGSTVREGEFATAQNAGGVPQKIIARYNNLLSGERLEPSQRQDFVNQARNMLSGRKQQYDKTRSKYKTLAQRAEVDPIDVVGEDEAVGPGGDLSTLSDDDLLKALGGG